MTTIHDVAAKAGVSIATVSRVINRTRFVDPEIEERVRVAIQDLDYRPNFVARGLRQRTTKMIGLLIPDNSNPFFAEVARAIEDAGYAESYSVILCNSDLSEEKQAAYIEGLLSRQVDGLILMSTPGSSDAYSRVLAANVPVVIANNETGGLNVDEVAVDWEQGGYTAGEYLVRLGHRRIGCIGGPSDASKPTARIKGFLRALTDSGVGLDQHAIAYGDGRYMSGRAAMRELLSRDMDLTAVFVFDDVMAIGAVNELQAAGVRVPEDISVIGFDNITYSAVVTPPITTVAQPITGIGRESLKLLLERIQNPHKERSRVVLSTRLVERSSCRAVLRQQADLAASTPGLSRT